MTEIHYRDKRTGADYRESYEARNGQHRAGLPVDSGTNIVNLRKVKGDGEDFIVTSIFDLEENFTAFEWHPIKGQKPTTGTSKDVPEKE